MTTLNDGDLIKAFETATIDPNAFDHVAHVRVAWLYLKSHQFFEALARLRAGLIALTTAHGAPQRYNETITLTFLSLIHERMHAKEEDSFACFAKDNPDLMTMRVVKRLYSAERLNHLMARRGFVLPDVSDICCDDTTPITAGRLG
jgi:hypothetical protein